MEKGIREEKNIFYIGIAEGESGKKRELIANGLPIRKAGRTFPYLFWEKRAVTAGLQVYFTFLPQFEKRIFGQRIWKPETAERFLTGAAERAGREWGCREQILVPGLGGKEEDLPTELWAVCLYRQRPFDRVCISLPGERESFVHQALDLLRPYLPRMRKAYFCGVESENSRQVKDALAEEFGLILMDVPEPEPGAVWLDLRTEYPLNDGTAGGVGKGGSGRESTAGKSVKWVNRILAWNFLDTTVKNGYNTKVN